MLEISLIYFRCPAALYLKAPRSFRERLGVFREGSLYLLVGKMIGLKIQTFTNY